MARSADLSSAAHDYLAQRASTKPSKAVTRRERRAITSFLAVNGRIWVHQVGDLQMTRAFAEHASSREDLTLVLDDFFNWCRHMGYLPRGADPLEKHRDGGLPLRDNYAGTIYGRCLGCGWIGLITPRRFEDPSRQRVASTRLCAACASALTLSDVFG